MIENYTVIDLEMTGLAAKTDAILEVGAVRVRGGKVQETFGALLKTERELSAKVTEITGITTEMMQEGRESESVMEEFFSFVGDDVLVGQNIIFDYSFLKQWAVNHKFSFERDAVDTLKLARYFLPQEEKKDLENLCRYLKIERKRAHRALDDALDTYQVFEKLKTLYGEQEPEKFTPYPLQYKAKKQTPATGRQIEHLKKYIAHYNIEVQVSLDGLTRSEASRLTDQLMAQYGKIPKA